MMRFNGAVLVMLAGAPLIGQAWDVRVERPFAHGQELPATMIQGIGALADRGLDRGDGLILTVNHRLIRVNPVLRLDWTMEYSKLKSDGGVQVGAVGFDSRLKQSGLGLGLNAQFWIPFTGVAGELGLIQRFQDYEFHTAGSSVDTHLTRTWLRTGVRWKFPMAVAVPYIAASYQFPLSHDRPTQAVFAPSTAAYLAAQGHGQEFDRLWTFGAGVQF